MSQFTKLLKLAKKTGTRFRSSVLATLRSFHDAPLKDLNDAVPKKKGISKILSRIRPNQRAINQSSLKALGHQADFNDAICESIRLLGERLQGEINEIESRLSRVEKIIREESDLNKARYDEVGRERIAADEKLSLQLIQVSALAAANIELTLALRAQSSLRDNAPPSRIGPCGTLIELEKNELNRIDEQPDQRSPGDLRVLYVANAYPPNFIGGAELVAHNHAKALRMAGVDVRVFAGEHSEGEWHDFFQNEFEGVPVWRLRLDSRDLSLASASQFVNKAAIQCFDRILAEFKPDVVHFHNLAGLGVSLILVATSRSIPVALTVHDHWGYCLRDMAIRPDGSICEDASECWKCMSVFESPLYFRTPVRLRRDFHHWCLSHCRVVFSPSKFLASKYETRSRILGQLQAFWNGVDCSKFSHVMNPQESRTCRFTFIGYLGEHKGVIPLIQAFGRLREEDVTLTIVGVGYLESKLKEMVVAEGVSSKVTFLGRIPNQEITSVFEKTDVFVLPSTCLENQPVSIAEAMASGCPIIASNCGGIPEMVEDGVSGLLCAPGNITELSDAMIRLAENPSLRRKMGENARLKISDVSYDRQMSRMLVKYKTLLSDGPLDNQLSVVLCHGEKWSAEAIKALEIIDEQNLAPNAIFLPTAWLSDSPSVVVVHWAVSAEGIGSALRSSVFDRAVALCPGYSDGMPSIIEKIGMGRCYANAEDGARMLTEMLSATECVEKI